MNTQVSQMKYSVLMSVYAKDNPLYLTEAIGSMLMQTVPPEQFVIVIDGPVPGRLRQVIDQYRYDNQDLFTVVTLKNKCSAGNALNAGLKQCRNEFVARMDPDGISLPQRCEKELLEFAVHPELSICGCNVSKFKGKAGNVRAPGGVLTAYAQTGQAMRRRQAFYYPTVIYKKTEAFKTDGYKNLNRKKDFYFFSKMLTAGSMAWNLSEPLYLYHAGRSHCHYIRRKGRDNLRSKMVVWRDNLQRQGCLIADFFIMYGTEVLFFIMPSPVVR